MKEWLTQEYLHSRLMYDEATGLATWRALPGSGRHTNSWNKKNAGKIAGTPVARKSGKKGYWGIHVDDCQYKAHRLFWTMVNGPIPDGLVIDHIDRDPYNNRLSNLRLCTYAENLRNRLVSPKNLLGIKGVSLHRRSGLYFVRTSVGGACVSGGYYKTLGLAAVVAAKESLRLHGKFSPYYRAA